MALKFAINDKHTLDTEKIIELLPAKQTLINLDLQKNDIMADIGCGVGYFTIPAAKIVGKNGRIFAMDIFPEMLHDVQIKIKENNISNINILLTEENDLKLKNNTVTFAFLSNVLYEIDEKEKFLSEVKRIICPEGKIAILEWRKIKSNFGPPIEDRLDEMDSVKMLDKLGFSPISTLDIGEDFYGIVAQK